MYVNISSMVLIVLTLQSDWRETARQCWSAAIVADADKAKKSGLGMDRIREGVANTKQLKDGTIMASFELKGKGKPTYSMQQSTYAETW